MLFFVLSLPVEGIIIIIKIITQSCPRTFPLFSRKSHVKFIHIEHGLLKDNGFELCYKGLAEALPQFAYHV